MQKLSYYLQRVFRLLVKPSNRKSIVWKDLKSTYLNLGWEHSLDENRKLIEASFIFIEQYQGIFIYQFEDDQVLYRGLIFEEFPDDMMSDLFILATHLNNVLTIGMVTINMRDHFVEFVLKEPFVKPFLFPEDIDSTIIEHLRMMDDIIFPSFYRLIYEKESPAIIIADALRNSRSSSEKESL